MSNKVEKKVFLGMEVRVVNGEYIVLKDMFSALGRVRSDGSWTDEKKKVEKILGKDSIYKIKIICENITDTRKTSQINEVLCVKQSELEKHDILAIFGKNGVSCTNYREEYSFIKTVKDFFKYNKHINIETQFNVMEFRIDIVIGDHVFVEFDEEQHRWNKQEDIERMQKISLAMTYSNGCLYNTNDFRKQTINTVETNDYFDVFKLNGALFIRVRDKNCLNWIPFVYEEYDEYMDFMYSKPNIEYKGLSEGLYNLKYVI